MAVAKRNRTRAKDPSQTKLKAEDTEEDEDDAPAANAEETDEETTEEYSKVTKSKKSSKTSAEDGDDEEDDKPAESARSTERQRMANLREAFPKDLDFAMEAFEAGWSVTKAKAEYCDRLTSGKAKLGGKESAKSSDGVKPLRLAGGSRASAPADEGDSTESGDPIADFSAAVRDRMKSGMNRTDAVKAVARAEPEMHKAYLLATNPGRRQQELIKDRFEMEKVG